MKNPMHEFWDALPEAVDNSPTGAIKRLREFIDSVGLRFATDEAGADLDIVADALAPKKCNALKCRECYPLTDASSIVRRARNELHDNVGECPTCCNAWRMLEGVDEASLELGGGVTVHATRTPDGIWHTRK